ncbi:MAG: flavin-dependent oxidoreductase [Alphaproteobacteria bacterium]|nr:flavin-dependent oxidoreductase [Alphaproteobacteria bacterium]
MLAIVAGGGIAGLTCALSLHQVGIACRVYEAVPHLAPLGYGINLQPNAVRELFALGLGERLSEAGILTAELAMYNKHGQLIWTEPRGRAAGYRWPQISISRGTLHEILLGAIRERIGADAVVTGRRLSSFEQRGDRVIARFVDPKGEPAGEAEGDVLIGADGIHSAVRRQFYSGEKAVFDGYLHYRGVVETEPYLTGASMVVVGHRHHRAILYPVARRPGGKVMVNWLAYTRIPPGSPPMEAWDTAADRQACVDSYKGWTYPWLDVRGLFAATPAEMVLQLPNVDRDPVPRWSFDRVTLIGDAAHPMQPVGAQAGSQAIVDGRVLAASMLESRNPVEALTRYQDRRIAAMNDMVLRNRSLGLETILQIAEERAPNGFAHIHDVLSQQELEATALNYKKAAGFDVEMVNSRDSFVELPARAS